MSKQFIEETITHIAEVGQTCRKLSKMIADRGLFHDASKLASPEKELFTEVGHRLKDLEYGSVEYEAEIVLLKPAIDHHYASNEHHPEHRVNGIAGFTLVDLLEAYADWESASLRTAGGTFEKSMEINAKRFGMPDVLVSIFNNTHRMLAAG